MLSVFSLLWLSGRSQISQYFAVYVSSYYCMTRLRPALQGSHKTNDKLFPTPLGKVVLELLRMILLELDILYYGVSNPKSARATARAGSVPEYTNVLRHAPRLMSLHLRRRLASCFSLSIIHTLLAGSSCTKRNRVDSFVLLLGSQRCCARCAAEDLYPLSITKGEPSRLYGVELNEMLNLPKVQHRVVRGYNFSQPRCTIKKDRASSLQGRSQGIQAMCPKQPANRRHPLLKVYA